MRRLIVGALCALSLPVTPGPGAVGLAFAGPVHPVFHQEAEALLDRAATELRALGTQLQQHMEMRRGPMGGMIGPGTRGPGIFGPVPRHRPDGRSSRSCSSAGPTSG